MGCAHADGGNPNYVCDECETDESGMRASTRGWVRGDIVPEKTEEPAIKHKKKELKGLKREWPKLQNGCKIVGEGVLGEFAGERNVGYYLCEAPEPARFKGSDWSFQILYFALLKSNLGPWLERDTPLPTAATAPDVQGSHNSKGGVK